MLEEEQAFGSRQSRCWREESDAEEMCGGRILCICVLSFSVGLTLSVQVCMYVRVGLCEGALEGERDCA